MEKKLIIQNSAEKSLNFEDTATRILKCNINMHVFIGLIPDQKYQAVHFGYTGDIRHDPCLQEAYYLIRGK